MVARTTSTRSAHVESQQHLHHILTTDQGLDAIEKKEGQDPSKMRSTNEKITDKARGMFEKATGRSNLVRDMFDRC